MAYNVKMEGFEFIGKTVDEDFYYISESWISSILFIMNLTKLIKVVGEYVIFWPFLFLEVLGTLVPPVLVSSRLLVNNQKVVLALENQQTLNK